MALDIITNINLDMKAPNSEIVYGNQYDTVCYVNAQLLNDGEKWEVPYRSTAVVSYMKSDRIGGYYDTTQKNEIAVTFPSSDRSKVRIALDEQTLTTVGNVGIQVNFYQGRLRLSTFIFILNVKASPINSTNIESKWFGQLLLQAGMVVDNTLTIAGAAADAKEAGKKVSKPTTSPNGVSGQVLSTNGDGTTTWINHITPTDEQVENAVDGWLDDHPEATTTVQDGSISPVKLDTALFNEHQRNSTDLIVHMIKGHNVNSERNIYGDCIIISGQKNGIIDFSLDSDGTDLISYLSDNNISALDFCVISHYHQDHISADFGTLFDNLVTAGIDFSHCVFYLPHKGIDWTQGVFSQTIIDDAQAVKTKLTNNSITFVEPDNGDVVTLEENMSLSFYNIGSAFYADYYDYYVNEQGELVESTTYNNFSMLTIINHNDKKFVFTGDFHLPAEANNYQYIKGCDVYKVEHHALNRSSDHNWLDVLNPSFAMVGSFADDYYDDILTRQTVSNLVNKGCRLLSTRDSDITIKSSKNGLECLDGVPYQVINLFNPSFLYEGEQLVKEHFPADVKTDGLIDIDKLKTAGVYYVQNGSHFTTNIKPISINGNTLTPQAFKLVVERTTQNKNAVKQTLLSAWHHYTGLHNYFRLIDDTNNNLVWTKWYSNSAESTYLYDTSLTTFTPLTANTSRISHVKGGYYQKGKKVYIRLEFNLLSDYRFGAGAYYVYAGAPSPALGSASLRAYTTLGDDVASKIVGAYIHSDRSVRLCCSGEFAGTTENPIVIEGEYIAS